MAGNFLETAGTGGITGTARVVTWTTALAGLAYGGATTSDATADTGIFSQSSFGNAPQLMAWFQTGHTNTMATTSGGILACWWLLSTDGGTTFESLVSTPSSSVLALPRTPDFIIPVYDTTALPVDTIKFAQGPFRYPYLGCKLVLQNLSGVAINSATGGVPTLTVAGVVDGYT